MFRWLLIAVLCFGVPGKVSAQAPPTEDYKAAANKFVSELMECFNFYDIVLAKMNRRKDAKTEASQRATAAYKSATDSFLHYAIITADKIGMTDKWIIARGKVIQKNHRKQMQNSMTNVSTLTLKYALPCKALAENPMARLNALIAIEARR